MKMYRLKPGAGKHVAGTDRVNAEGKVVSRARTYRSSDPRNNIVKSDQPLSRMMPEKFEDYTGPEPPEPDTEEYEEMRLDPESPFYEPPPPNPPSEAQRAESVMMAVPRTPAEMKEFAKRLQEQAKVLEEAASEIEKSQQQAAQKQKQAQERGKARSQKGGQATGTAATQPQKGQAHQTEEDRQEQERRQAEAASQQDEEYEEGAEEGQEEEQEEEEDGLEQMTVKDLRDLAHQEEVEVTSSMTKAQLVEAIRSAREE